MKRTTEQTRTKRNIVLIGSMGTGKSRIGSTLAREMGWQFVDTDLYLERRYGEKLADIGARLGAAELARAEREVIERVRFYHEAVIAVGGNFLLAEEIFTKLREHGVMVLLYAQNFRIVERVGRRQGKRPTMDYENLPVCVADLNRRWRHWRRRSDWALNTTYRSPVRITAEIRRFLRSSPFRFAAQRRTGRKGNFHGKKNRHLDQWR